jgi:hypothetical protein
MGDTCPLRTSASLAGPGGEPEKTVPQGQDPPGAENGKQQSPPTEDKEVIPPPPIGDEEIHTEAPNPKAGHEEEVIPPPASFFSPSVMLADQRHDPRVA